MASVNKVILVGNCGRDPEVRYLPSGQAVANVSIATSSKRKDRNSGEMIEDTQWHRITFYDRLAEIAGEFVKKGRPIYVEGRLKYGTYTDKTTGVEKTPSTLLPPSYSSWAGVKALVPLAVAVKRVATAVRQRLDLPQRQQEPAPKRPQKAALTTWTTIFRSDANETNTEKAKEATFAILV
jgi:single-strand DNA-binding protein